MIYVYYNKGYPKLPNCHLHLAEVLNSHGVRHQSRGVQYFWRPLYMGSTHLSAKCNSIFHVSVGNRDLMVIVDGGSTTLAAAEWGVSHVTHVKISIHMLNPSSVFWSLQGHGCWGRHEWSQAEKHCWAGYGLRLWPLWHNLGAPTGQSLKLSCVMHSDRGEVNMGSNSSSSYGVMEY